MFVYSAYFSGRVAGTTAAPAWSQGRCSDREASLARRGQSPDLCNTVILMPGAPQPEVIPGKAFTEGLEILSRPPSLVLPWHQANLRLEELFLVIVFV